MRYLTGTSFDSTPSVDGSGWGFPPGLIAVWDESEGYVAATELCYRVALAAVMAGVDVMWADVRGHLVDVLGDLDGPLVKPFQLSPGQVIVSRLNEHWTADRLRRICTCSGSDPMVYIVDSLPAATHFVDYPQELRAVLADITTEAMASGSLVVVCTYAVSGNRSSQQIGVGAGALNLMAHTAFAVTHQKQPDGWKFGINMPKSRTMFPDAQWRWDDAKLTVGA